jgi:hypothetical protein
MLRIMNVINFSEIKKEKLLLGVKIVRDEKNIINLCWSP